MAKRPLTATGSQTLNDSQVDGALRTAARSRRTLGLIDAAQAVSREVTLHGDSRPARRAADAYAAMVACYIVGHNRRRPRSQSKLLTQPDLAALWEASRRGALRFIALTEQAGLEPSVMLSSALILSELEGEWAEPVHLGKSRRLSGLAERATPSSERLSLCPSASMMGRSAVIAAPG